MILFFRLSKTILVIFIVACLLRLAFVFCTNSGYISMGNAAKKGNISGTNESNDSKSNNKQKNNDNQKDNIPKVGNYPKDGNMPVKNDENSPMVKDSTQNKNSGNTKNTSDRAGKETGEYFLTSAEVGLINNMSLKDKISGLSILCKMNKKDIDRILSIANGGITLVEYKEIEEIFRKSLSLKDMDILKELMMRNKKLYAEGNTGN